MFNFIQTKEIKDLIGLQDATIIGVLVLVIVGMIALLIYLEKGHRADKKLLREDIISARDKLEEVQKTNLDDTREIAKNQITVTTTVLEKLNTLTVIIDRLNAVINTLK